MSEIHGRCLACGATITIPMPDAWDDGEEIIQSGTLSSAENLDDMQRFLHALPCPNCGAKTIRVTGPTGGEE
jgi:ribosomal protein S27E